MIDGPLVFVDVDTQVDFLDPAGTLFIPGSEVILANLEKLTRYARDRRVPVIATACAHTADEIDPEPFPPHCLVGSEGQRRVSHTHRPDSTTLRPDQTFELGAFPVHLTLEKTRYDVFSRADGDQVVSAYGSTHPTFVVYGVATDYCVRAAVLGLLERAQKVAVVVDSVWAIDHDREVEHFREFVERGATLVVTDAIVC